MDEPRRDESEYTRQGCERCVEFVAERHRRHEAERSLQNLQLEREKYTEATKRALIQLDDVASVLPTLYSLTEAYESLKQIHAASSAIAKKLGDFAFLNASSLKEKSAVLNLCEQVGGLPGNTVRLRGIQGLPRLRVFSDEDCSVQVCIIDAESTVLWSSQSIPVAQSRENPAYWCTGAEAQYLSEIPLCLLNSNAESKLGVLFESSIVAETVYISDVELMNAGQLQLFHDDVPLESAAIVFDSMDFVETVHAVSTRSVELRLLSVRDVEFDMDSEAEEDKPCVIVRCPQSRNQTTIFIGDSEDSFFPSGSLEIASNNLSELLSIDVDLVVGTVTVASGSGTMATELDGKLDIQLYSERGVPNGWLILEYSCDSEEQPREAMAAYRCG